MANLAPVCRELRKRGHPLSLAGRRPATARALAADAFDAILQSPVYHRGIAPAETLTYGQVIGAGGFEDLLAARALVRRWLEIFEASSPELLLVEHAPASLLAAYVAGIRAVRVGQSFVAPQPRDAEASLLPWAHRSAAQLAAARRLSDTVVRETCRAFGAQPLDGVAALLATASPHVLGWPELDHFGPGPTDTYYGPLPGIAGRARPDWPGRPGPRILVYLPFNDERGRAVVEALARLELPTIWHAPHAAPVGLPRNIHYCATPVDLWSVAFSAELFIGRAGAGTSAVALRAGLPQLLFPDTLESLLLTYRLRNAGVARSARSSIGGDGVATTIREMLADDAAIARARGIGARYAGYSPVMATRRLADDLLGSAGPNALANEPGASAIPGRSALF